MTTQKKEKAYLRRQRRMWERGAGLAHNVAASYRILGKPHLAFKWWQRAVDAGDESFYLEIGYCYQHGAGVRKNFDAAARSYRRCLDASYVSEVDREEAMYLLATVALLRGRANDRKKATELLRTASRDGDYPEATELIQQIRRGDVVDICTCRRFLRPMLKRQLCALHRPRRGPRR